MTHGKAFYGKPGAEKLRHGVKAFLASLAATVSLCALARVSDGLYFDLKTLGDLDGNGKADLTETVNAMAVGSSGGGAAEYGRALAFSAETAYRDFFYFGSPERQAVKIKQSYEEVNGKWATKLDALVFRNPAATASCAKGRTLFCRFYWDGYAYPKPNQACIAFDSWSYSGNAGYGFSVKPLSDGVTSALEVWVGKKNKTVENGDGSYFAVVSNQWYDVMLRYTTDGETTDVKLMRGHRGVYDEWNATALATPLVADGEGRLVIGGETYGDAWVIFEKTAASPKSFNGRIAELKIWNRALDDDEARAVFAGFWGESLSLGAANGSSDEFGANPEPVFDPAAMDCGKLRKELTADNPSLFIETDFREEEDCLGKTVLLTPVMSDVVSCPVQLFVNGELADQAVLSDGVECALRVRRRNWKPNASGRISLEVRRTGNIAGTLGIDALSIGGGWQLGKADGNYDDFSVESGPEAVENFYIGDPDTQRHLRRAIFETRGTKTQKKITLNTYVPASLVNVRAWLGFKVANKKTPDVTSRWTVKLNGSEFWSGDLLKKDDAEVEIPAGTFRTGLNAFTFSHDCEQSDEWAGMDYYRLVFEDKPRGLSVVIR